MDAGRTTEDRMRPASPSGRSPVLAAAGRLLSHLAELEPALERRIPERGFVPLSVSTALLLAVLFSTPGFGPGSSEYERDVRRSWSPAVLIKIEDPLRDMSRAFPAATNQAKRTFRITAPAVAYVTGTGIRGAVIFEYACAYAVLHAAVVLGRRLLGTRGAGFWSALLLASTYFGSAAFKDAFYWFDSVAYGLLMLAMVASHPSLRALALFAACFSDERAFLVLPLTFACFGDAPEARRTWRGDVLATAAAGGAYLALRVALRLTLGLPLETAGIGAFVLAHVLQAVPCLWAPFEGAWLVFLAGGALLLGRLGPVRPAALLAASFFPLYLLSCYLIVDVTRSMSFAFVALYPTLQLLAQRCDHARVRALLMLAALVSLLTPNLFVWHELTFEVGLLARLLPSR
jgi:hypothetical protein